MISGLKIGNFKAFSETQYVPIRPLTLVFGPNSSGKSSLIHSLILAHQGMEKGDLDVHRTTIGGESVDLGGFKQYVFRRDTSNQVEWAVEYDTNTFEGRLAEIFKTVNKVTVGITISMALKNDIFKGIDEDVLKLMQMQQIEDLQCSVLIEMIEREGKQKGQDTVHPELEKYRYSNLPLREFFEMNREPQVTTYRIEVDNNPILKMSKRKGGFLRLDTINTAHPIFKTLIKAMLETSTTTDQVSPEDFEAIDDAVTEIVSTISTDIPEFLPQGLKKGESTVLEGSAALLAISKDRRREDLVKAFNLFFPRSLDDMISGLRQKLKEHMDRLRYLGPLRSYPPRHLAFSQYHDPNWLAGGGYAWEEVRKDPGLRKKVNEWLSNADKLSTPYELVVRHLLTIDELEKHYSKSVGKIEDEFTDHEKPYTGDLFGDIYAILSDLKPIEQYLSEVGELVLRDKRTESIVSHRDVGIGISQVLPVLVSAYGNKEAIIAIEQPEIHLHPALQAELGDVFIESALGENKNTLIIETHSEHLILRLLRRIRETTDGELPEGMLPITPDKLAVLYIQPEKTGSKVVHIPVTEDGEFEHPWPEGFFPERAKELF